MDQKALKLLKNKNGSVMIWFMVSITILVFGILHIIFLLASIPDKHSIDGFVEAASLAGASNVVDAPTEDLQDEVIEVFDKEKADVESEFLVKDNIKLNRLDERVTVKLISSEVEETPDGDKWYKISITFEIKVIRLLPFGPNKITYVSTAHSIIEL